MSEEQRGGSERSATERADELLNRVGWTLGLFGSMIGMRLARVAAFAREEAEDMWAEAQSIRRQNGGNLGATVSKVADTARAKVEETKEDLKQRVAPEEEEAKTGTATAEAPPDAEEQKPDSEQGAEPDGEVETIKATDTARQRAEELGVDLREVEGTGAGGQITVSDVKKKAEAES
jgi:pyruvate/2-oxoglutarate dehydrogenase complex dihydrolipoamide acyltransferase (E2) component